MATIGKFKKGKSFFSPRDIPGCSCWIDAADVSKISLTGNIVTSVSDKGTDGGNFTKNGTVTWSPNVFNTAYPGFETINGNFVKSLTTKMTKFRHTIFIVAKTNNTGIGDGLPCVGLATSVDGTSNFYRVIDNVTANSSFRTIAFSSSLFLASTASTTNNFIYSGTLNGLSISSRLFSSANSETIFNSPGTTGSEFAVDGGAITIGTDAFGASPSPVPGSTNTWPGIICEVILYADVILSNSDRRTVEGYLAWKWGLVSNLPVTHPFKNSPPVT